MAVMQGPKCQQTTDATPDNPNCEVKETKRKGSGKSIKVIAALIVLIDIVLIVAFIAFETVGRSELQSMQQVMSEESQDAASISIDEEFIGV